MTTLIPWWKNMPATHRQIMKIGMNSKMFCLKTNNGIKVTIDISIIILCGTFNLLYTSQGCNYLLNMKNLTDIALLTVL